MRHNDFGGHQVRVFYMVDQLGSRFDPQLVGIDVHGGQLRGSNPRKQGVVEGDDRQIPGDGNPFLCADPLQRDSQDIVAGYDGRRAVFLV